MTTPPGYIDLSTTPRSAGRSRDPAGEGLSTAEVQPAKRPRPSRHIVEVDLSHEQGTERFVDRPPRQQHHQREDINVPVLVPIPGVRTAAETPLLSGADGALSRPRLSTSHLWGEVKDDEHPGLGPPRYAPPSARSLSYRNRTARPHQHMPSAPSTSLHSDSSAAPRSSRSAGEQGPACDAVLARKLQEEEDRRVAHEVAMHYEQEEDKRLQARLNAWEALEEENDAREQANYRRSRSTRSAAPMFEAFGGPGLRRNRAPGGGPGGLGSSGGGSWGSMSLSALLLGGGWHGRHRQGGPGGAAARGMRDVVAGLVDSGLPPHLLFSDRDFTADDYEALCRLDEKVENRKGATQQDIDVLPTHVVRDTVRPLDAEAGAQSCSICLEDVVPGAVLRLLPCTHKFHQSCIDRWLQQRATCPICQKPCGNQGT